MNTITVPTHCITPQAVVAKVRELALAFPDNVYQPECTTLEMDCLYTGGGCSNGSCGCIVGQALLALGISRHTLLGFDVGQEDPVGIYGVLESLGICDRRTFEAQWLKGVQVLQDKHVPWGEAVIQTDELMEDGYLTDGYQ